MTLSNYGFYYGSLDTSPSHDYQMAKRKKTGDLWWKIRTSCLGNRCRTLIKRDLGDLEDW